MLLLVDKNIVHFDSFHYLLILKRGNYSFLRDVKYKPSSYELVNEDVFKDFAYFLSVSGYQCDVSLECKRMKFIFRSYASMNHR